MSKYNNAIISVCVILNVHIEYIYKMFVTKHYTNSVEFSIVSCEHTPHGEHCKTV